MRALRETLFAYEAINQTETKIVTKRSTIEFRMKLKAFN